MAQFDRDEPTWYTDSFIILHADHHTREDWAVGADADPATTAASIDRIAPDVIQIHAKGNPGWTTYPSTVGYTPPDLRRDVLGLWRQIARERGKPFSVYYNLGRDGEIMKQRPEWNRVDAGGVLRDRMLSYATDVRTEYLWPQIDEIIEGYDPDGFWFDGSCFTVLTSYQLPELDRRQAEHGGPVPRTSRALGYDDFKELHRQLYRELIHDTARRIHEKKPDCLVAVNLAYTTLMPEKPDEEIDYLTVDIADNVSRIGPVAAMMDGQEKPFDLMVAVWYSDARHIGDVERTLSPKPAAQLQQEASIILSHGGRFSAWDTPTPGSALAPDRVSRLAEVVPWIRERRPWCERSRNVPTVSVLHSDLTHYANTADDESCFRNSWPSLQIQCDMLDAHHLPYEVIPAWRLAEGRIAGKLLVVEDPHVLRDEEIAAIEEFAGGGGRVLLTGDALVAGGAAMRHVAGIRFVAPTPEPVSITIEGGRPTAVAVSRFYDTTVGEGEIVLPGRHEGREVPVCVRNGSVFYSPTPLHAELVDRGFRPFRLPSQPGELSEENLDVSVLWDEIMAEALPEADRPILTNAPPWVHVTLRDQPSDERLVIHLVNRNPGRVTEGTLFPRIEEIMDAESFSLSLRLAKKPRSVSLAPEPGQIGDYAYHDGLLELQVPGFPVHSMLVVQR